MQKQLPDFTFEKEYWKRGINLLGGIDEVGRGALAGPLVASCVVFSPTNTLSYQTEILINDSKKMSPKQRLLADKWIQSNSICYGIGVASVYEINKYGIVKATNKAFRRAVKATNHNLEHLLIDAFYIPRFFVGRQKAIIRGDNLSLSIAAASIVAKVYRDAIMIELSQKPKYKKYLWNKNKGYGTHEHLNAIERHGIINYHRTKFVSKWLNKK